MTKIQIRYNDCDRMGIIHHSKYVEYYEIARLDVMNKVIPYQDFEKLGFFFALYEINIKYNSPIKLGDEVFIETKLLSFKNAKIEFEQNIIVNSEIKSTAIVKAVTVNDKTKPISLKKLNNELYVKFIDSISK